MGHKIKSGKKFCPLNFAQKCVFSSSEGIGAWKMKFQVPKSIFSKIFWCVHRMHGGFQNMFWGPGGCLGIHLKVLDAIWGHFTKIENFEFFSIFSSKKWKVSFACWVFGDLADDQNDFFQKIIVESKISSTYLLIWS